jgi:hypothetical protein
VPRDKRLYITLPVDIHRHPKFRRASTEAKWAFVEMNIEAKIADNDGVFPAEEAEWHWPKTVLDELVNSHPTRPVVARVDDTYVIREYDEHQESRARREERRATNVANGKKGGRPKKNPNETDSVSGGLGQEPNRTQPKAESRVQSPEHRDTTHLSESSPVTDRARQRTDEEKRSDELARSTLAAGMQIDPDRLLVHIRQRTARELFPGEAMRVAMWLLDKGTDVKTPQRYVLRCITQSWAEVQQYIDTHVLPA